MSHDFLRDVLRTDDAAGQPRRRWLLFPLSLLVHCVGALAYLIIPLAAEVIPPTPAPLFANHRWVVVVAPPSETPPALRRNPVLPSSGAAPRESPPSIAPEDPVAAPIPAIGGVDGLSGLSAALPDDSSSAVPAAPAPPPPPAAPLPDRGPVKVGGAIRAPLRLAGSAPVYPPIALAARVEGQVLLEALIDEQGRVGGVRVVKSVPLLDAAAVNAVRTWRYTPTLLNGVPVSVLMTVTVSFTLQH